MEYKNNMSQLDIDETKETIESIYYFISFTWNVSDT
jgi:hypothetical protein